MDVRLSPEQEALRDSAAQVVDRLGPRTVAALDDRERRAKLGAAVEAAGWRELRTADDAGNPWASGVEVGLVAEQLGRGLADAAFFGPTLACELRRRAGLAPATEPETVALDADLGSLGATVAVDAAGATHTLAVIGDRLARIPLALADVGVDLTRSTVTLDPSAALPLARGSGVVSGDDLAGWTALGLAVTCADLVGVMDGAVRLACEYARDRQQFGTSVGSFQAVQHLLADAFVLTEGSRSTALHAAWAVDAMAPGEALMAAAQAKAYCARSAREVCETAIQVHGGIGNTWECLAHVYLRRALASADLLGGVGPNLTRVLAHHGIGAADGLR